MNKKEVSANLVQVKLALAAKCERMAKITTSTPKCRTMLHQAAKFRRQAADLSRQ